MFVRTRADLLFARPNLLFKYCTCLLFEMSHVPLLLKPNSKTGIKITVIRTREEILFPGVFGPKIPHPTKSTLGPALLKAQFPISAIW